MHQMPEHVGFSVEEHGAIPIQTVDPDFERIYADLDGTPTPDAQPMELAADGLREILHWIWESKGKRRKFRSALVRLVVLTAVMKPALLDCLSYRELGKRLGGITKQALSHQAINFENAFQIKFARSRSKQSREHMAAARRGGVNHNTGKQKARTQYENTNPEKPS